ncbi:MAG: hypothetical protein EAX96_16055 [Candidatus Lokiarchaeota archaeon]|nr:hypothetical protein [Candidatus Lokiarchaeota archaeon]
MVSEISEEMEGLIVEEIEQKNKGTCYSCPFCRKKYKKHAHFFNHLVNNHLEKRELQEMVDIYYNYIIKEKISEEIINLNNSEIKKSGDGNLFQRLLLLGDNSEIQQEYLQNINNKTLLKYNSLIKKYFTGFLKYLFFKFGLI